MTHKIKIKVGSAEFEAEGTAEDVESQFTRFMALLEKAPPQVSPLPPPASRNGNGQEQKVIDTGDLDLARIFDLRQDGYVTLKLLPKGESRESDAFLLLLLGCRELKQEERVLATHILRAAQFSGISSLRPADAAAATEPYIIRGGQKKGSTYMLNNQGLVRAKEIAAKMFE